MSAPGDWPEDGPVDPSLLDPSLLDAALLDAALLGAEPAAAPVDERIAAAVLREEDAAGAVEVAAVQLAELQEKGDTARSKIVAAEHKLASAKRHHQAAREGIVRAQQKVAAEAADRVDREAAAADAERAAAAAEPAAPALQFTTLPAFVAFFTELYRREVFEAPERVWCPQWWQHAEAAARLEAIWRAYEALRHEPGTGMSVWFLVHVDPHMSQLLAPHGTFRGCHAKRGHSTSPLPPFPLAEPPADWWPEEQTGL